MLITAVLSPQPEILPMDNNPQTIQIIIKSDCTHINKVQEQIINEAKKYNCSKKDIFSLSLALEEALANAIHHGNKDIKEADVVIDFAVDDKKITIGITDQGAGFNSEELPDPTLEENLGKPSGRGVLLMRSYMDEIIFNERGNKVTMVKHFTG